VTTRADAIAWFDAGFTPLICVIPPDATLAPQSAIAPDARGKAPGRVRSDLTWAGYGWRTYTPTSEDVRQWVRDGANIGLATEHFPTVDIDVTDVAMADEIAEMAVQVLGAAPCRVGRHPKRALLYRTAEPFTHGRVLLRSADGQVKHLVEVLGQGQQFVAFGTHPATRQEYAWSPALPSSPAELSNVSAIDVRMFLAAVKERFEARGWSAQMDGAGMPGAVDRSSDHLRAPSLSAVGDAVACIPNTSALFPDRLSYLNMGYAIKASAGVGNEEDAFSVYAEWAGRWQDGVNDPQTVRDDWRRAVPPYRVGWDWLSGLAKQYGYDDAANDFTPTDSVSVSTEPSPLFGTDHWLAEKMVDSLGRLLRYAPEVGRWYVWDGARWEPDAMFKAEAMVNRELVAHADRVARMGSTPEEKKKYYRIAEAFLSSARASAVRKVMESNPALAIQVASFDSDPWLINTPGGIIDLREGKLKPADSAALMSKTTSVSPEFDRDCPRWIQFLNETTGDDQEFIDYLQRYAGYCLTGLTNEQMLMYVWGGGGNGKSLFLNVLSGIMHTYAIVAPSNVFTQSMTERHSTEVAMMAGMRLVLASEIEYGKKWDQVRIKSLTGGEPISARFMRQDNFVFTPTFKLLIAGNAKPTVTNMDAAMRRRIRLVPFTRTPAVVDTMLGEKLKAEWPAILAWMVRGCVAWAAKGLGEPAAVVASTDAYFEDEDTLVEWTKRSLISGNLNHFTPSRDLWQSWAAWCRNSGENAGCERDLIQRLSVLGMVRARNEKGVRGFRGVRLLTEALADLI
jgi:putative DNA primase/helicase